MSRSTYGMLGIWSYGLKTIFYMLPRDGVTETRSRWTVICPTKQVLFGQEPIFLRVYGMCLHFHNETLSQIEDSLYTHRRRKWRKRKQEIRDSILATQQGRAKQSKT